MTANPRSLLFAGFASFLGGVACSDDGQVTPPQGDAGQTTTEQNQELSTSTDAESSSSIVDGASSSSAPGDDAAVSSSPSASSTAHESTAPELSSEVSMTSDASAEMSTSAEPSLNPDAGDAGLDGSVDADVTYEPVEFSTPRGPCDVADRTGRFIIEAQKNFGIVQGTFSDGVTPTSIPDIVYDDGVCRLDRRRTLSCVPACVSGETCGEDGACIPKPRNLSVGDIEITGLLSPTEITPQVPGFTYLAPGASNPPYGRDSEIILTATGSGQIPRFHLFGVGSAPLTQDPTWVINDGEDLSITWPSGGTDAPTTVLVELTIDQHGTSPLSLSCEFPDTGSAQVPAELIGQLLGAGVSGFPNGRITRRTADHVDVPLGCIELAVGSPRSANVFVTGYTPCMDSGDCPNGQTCNLALQQCQD